VDAQNVHRFEGRCGVVADRALERVECGIDAFVGREDGAQAADVERSLNVWRDATQLEIAGRGAKTCEQTDEQTQARAVDERHAVEIEDEVAVHDLKIAHLAFKVGGLRAFDDPSLAFDGDDIANGAVLQR
jgi:hypothetical protein